uniref:Cytochrome c oxidase assembly factor 7 homolog n=1 Tax=Cacopsylla melanoneura TaxID=428564 RepID=A0A8D8M3A8_9HEMI
MLATSPLIINLIVVKFSVTLKRQAVPNPEMNSGDEKETKEYIKNLGIEYRFGCYSEKNPEACHLLGDYLDAIQKDMEKAMKVYKAYFDDAAYPRSCFQYGRLLMRDKNITEQEKLDVALENFKKSCALNNPLGCFQASGLLLVGVERANMPPNKPLAFEYAVKACDLDDLRGCVNASIMCRKGDGIPENLQKAEEFKKKALELQKMYTHDGQGIQFQQGI